LPKNEKRKGNDDWRREEEGEELVLDIFTPQCLQQCLHWSREGRERGVVPAPTVLPLIRREFFVDTVAARRSSCCR
jgi:hypothetical protein